MPASGAYVSCQEPEVQMFAGSVRGWAMCSNKVDSEGAGLGHEGFIGSWDNVFNLHIEQYYTGTIYMYKPIHVINRGH